MFVLTLGVGGLVGLDFIVELVVLGAVISFLAVKLDFEVVLISPLAKGFLSADFGAAAVVGGLGLAGSFVVVDKGLEDSVGGLVGLKRVQFLERSFLQSF